MHTGIAFIYLLESCSFVNLEILSFLAITTPYANCTDGQLRLVGGTNIREGRVEICINNACMAIDFLLEMNLIFEVAYYKLPQIWL